jgi:hypothetical protein
MKAMSSLVVAEKHAGNCFPGIGQKNQVVIELLAEHPANFLHAMTLSYTQTIHNVNHLAGSLYHW